MMRHITSLKYATHNLQTMKTSEASTHNGHMRN